MKNVLEWYLASNKSVGRSTEKYPEGTAGISVKASRLAAWIIWKMEGGVWQNLRRNIKNREHTSYAWGSRILSSQYWMTKLKNAGWQDRILSEVWSWAGSLHRNMRSWSTAKRSRHFSLNTERSDPTWIRSQGNLTAGENVPLPCGKSWSGQSQNSIRCGRKSLNCQVILLAVIKHIKSHNANYSATMDYLLFQHDEKTGEILRNELGQNIFREEFFKDGLNCNPDTFDIECRRTN